MPIASVRVWLGITLTLGLLTLASTQRLFATSARPNFLIILTDDHGYGDVSTYGPSDVVTPHLDQLAAEGMLFTRMRANATVCSPSRAALLTGLYPDRAGVPGVIRTDPSDSWGWLNPKLPTLASHLHRSGYRTALIGKWHLGLEPSQQPNNRGFEEFKGFLGDMMDSYTNHLRHGINYMRHNRKQITPRGHATDLFTDWAIEFLANQRSKKRPFFLYLAYNAPHFPIEPPADWLERVKRRRPDLSAARARNVALIEHLDHNMGRLLAFLQEAGLDGNTLVAFTSDNGGSLAHAQSNAPWRGGKQSHYEGGLRVPFMVRWPGIVKPRTTNDHAGLVFDLFPTVIDAAGLKKPSNLDARTLLPMLRGRPGDESPRDLYFVRREGGVGYGGKSYEALIQGDWKLLQNSPYSPLELYNLREDPHEEHNLQAEQPALVGRLSALLRAHIQRGGRTPWQPPQRP